MQPYQANVVMVIATIAVLAVVMWLVTGVKKMSETWEQMELWSISEIITDIEDEEGTGEYEDDDE